MACASLPIAEERCIEAVTDGRHSWAAYRLEQLFVVLPLENRPELEGLNPTIGIFVISYTDAARI